MIGKGQLVKSFLSSLTGGTSFNLDDVDEIIFYDHSGNEDAFRQSLADDGIIGSIHSNGMQDRIISDGRFQEFYRSSSVILFAPGSMIKPCDGFLGDVHSSLMKDFRAAGNGMYSDSTQYPTFIDILVDVAENGSSDTHSQAKFLSSALEVGNFSRFIASLRTKTGSAEGSEAEYLPSVSPQQRVTLEAMLEVFAVKKEGMLPLGLRYWECFAPTMHMLIEYGRKFRETCEDPELNPKPIIVTSNEPSMACNILSLLSPKMTPYLVGFMDYDSRRIRKDLCTHFTLDEQTAARFGIGVIGSHDSPIPVFSSSALQGLNLDPQLVQSFFANLAQSYVTRTRQQPDGNLNTEVNESLVYTINSALSSLGVPSRIQGSFYNAIFMPFAPNDATVKLDLQQYEREVLSKEPNRKLHLDYISLCSSSGIFTPRRHGFRDGRCTPLSYELAGTPEERHSLARRQANHIADNIILLYRLLTNPYIAEHLVDRGHLPAESAARFPYVESSMPRSAGVVESYETPLPCDNMQFVLSTGRRIVTLEGDYTSKPTQLTLR